MLFSFLTGDVNFYLFVMFLDLLLFNYLFNLVLILFALCWAMYVVMFLTTDDVQHQTTPPSWNGVQLTIRNRNDLFLKPVLLH